MPKYLDLIEQRARQELESLSKAQQRAIIEAYNSAGKEFVRQYRNAKGGTATKAMYASYTKKIADETQQLIEQYAIEGARVPLSVEKLIMQEAFKVAGLDTSLANDKFDNIIGKLGMESVKNVIGGKIYKDGAGLSSRIWQASATANNKIQEVITAGLAQNMGAAKLSKLLQDYVNPTARKTWGNDKIQELLGDGYAAWNKNLEYNALRLARTTLAHTATMSMRQARNVNPYATKIMWHSVHAAGRTCSICEEMDGQIYDTDKCPFDHPNGMCYQTHEFDKSLDEIADELAAWCNGEPNDMLDEWWKSIGGEEKPGMSREALMSAIQPLIDNMNVGRRRGFPEKYYNEFVDELMKCDEDYKRLWAKYAKDISSHESNGSSEAWYMRGRRRLCISVTGEYKQAVNRGLDKFSVLCHEMGHHFDNMTIYGKGSGLGYSSSCNEFIDAMLKDHSAILALDMKEVSQDMWRSDFSKGVQDAFEGLKVGRYKWGHGEKYWNRNGEDGRNAMVASELFAHISSANYSPGEMEYINKYFPESVKVFKKIITEQV